jgi:hypothetical protein
MNKLLAAHTNIEEGSEILIAVGVGILIVIVLMTVFLAKGKKTKK